MSRFDYVRYDDTAVLKQQAFKAEFEGLEELAEGNLKNSRAKSLFLTSLEEAYMWVGKAIRDEQIERGSAPADVPERTNE